MRYSNQAPWKSVRLGYLALNALRASIAAALSANETLQSHGTLLFLH